MRGYKIDKKLFRSLDIRGAEPDYVKSLDLSANPELANSAHGTILDEAAARIIGQAIATTFKAKKVVVGHDARLSSPALCEALIEGLLQRGAHVDFIGLCSTDQLYFAVGHNKYQIGIEVTGSHTIKQLNGFKIVRYKDGKVYPVASGLGMEKLRDSALAGKFSRFKLRGHMKKAEISDIFNRQMLSYFDYGNFAPAKIVFDAGNGVAGVAFERILDSLPIEAIKLNFQPDGHFPNHEPDPMIEENNTQLIEVMQKEGADFGVSWDGDADRIAVITSRGELITGSFFAPLLLPWVLRRYPHATTIATVSMSHAMEEVALANNAKVEISAVGNSNVTLAMDVHDAPFAAEEADHFMFRESYNSESGILPLLIVLDEMTRYGKSFDDLLAEARMGYYISGDVNIEIKDADKTINALLGHFQQQGVACRILYGDLVVDTANYHFALHPSFNDPVVRLNLEAKSPEMLKEGVAEVKNLINELTK